jgi:hypothetical protein
LDTNKLLDGEDLTKEDTDTLNRKRIMLMKILIAHLRLRKKSWLIGGSPSVGAGDSMPKSKEKSEPVDCDGDETVDFDSESEEFMDQIVENEFDSESEAFLEHEMSKPRNSEAVMEPD